VRCGIHTGVIEQRDGDFFGGAVSARRESQASRTRQALVSEVVATLYEDGFRGTSRCRTRARCGCATWRIRVGVAIVHPRLRRGFPLRSLDPRRTTCRCR
jgi:hypothetical protein